MRRTVYFLFILSVVVTLLLYQTHLSTIHLIPKINSVSKPSETTHKTLPIVDIGVLQDLDVDFLPNFKNPCWFEARDTTDEDRVKVIGTPSWKSSSGKRLQSEVNSDVVLQCLPYFFLIGQPKCGTTDIFHRINIHPDVVEPKVKGPHWWSRKRFGPPFAKTPVTLTEYMKIFNSTLIGETEETEASHMLPFSHHVSKKITGDGSTSTLWDSSPTMRYLQNILTSRPNQAVIQRLLAMRNNNKSKHFDVKNVMQFDEYQYVIKTPVIYRRKKDSDDKRENNEDDSYDKVKKNTADRREKDNDGDDDKGIVLPFTVADVIHSVLPKSQIIVVVREPIARLYSSYLFFKKAMDLSPQHFDECVKYSVEKWKECTTLYSDRTCAYNKTLQNTLKVRLYNGLYSVFLQDWLRVFPQQQVLVVRMEDYHTNVTQTLHTIYTHLGLRPLTDEEEKKVIISPVLNKNKRKGQIGQILNSTIQVLEKFYQPYNRQLSHILGNSKFMWKDIH
ncbi:hypothetical protein Pmani_003357 [Petrolisthes manimaculis]|uniref:Sulfotransferase domain-containing protein n=1 Tax=Petrolisthes manimaculis TaxID=1843537 RepID=A0AAE1UQ35_9EUCA|nr:hypothetical protein Pmani_003357 [Petrolisthes manimaculis]